MTKKIIMALCAFSLVACGGLQVRPEVVPYTYDQVGGMTAEEFEVVKLDVSAKETSDRFVWLELEKFRNGDPVERKVGTLSMSAVFDPLLRVGHFTFVNDPKGIEGEITTSTFIVSVTEEGLVVRDEETGKITVLTKDVGRTPDVARLIIAKMGDILASASQGVIAADIRADSCENGNCAGDTTLMNLGGNNSAGALANSASKTKVDTSAVGSGCATGGCTW